MKKKPIIMVILVLAMLVGVTHLAVRAGFADITASDVSSKIISYSWIQHQNVGHYYISGDVGSKEPNLGDRYPNMTYETLSDHMLDSDIFITKRVNSVEEPMPSGGGLTNANYGFETYLWGLRSDTRKINIHVNQRPQLVPIWLPTLLNSEEIQNFKIPNNFNELSALKFPTLTELTDKMNSVWGSTSDFLNEAVSKGVTYLYLVKVPVYVKYVSESDRHPSKELVIIGKTTIDSSHLGVDGTLEAIGLFGDYEVTKQLMPFNLPKPLEDLIINLVEGTDAAQWLSGGLNIRAGYPKPWGPNIYTKQFMGITYGLDYTWSVVGYNFKVAINAHQDEDDPSTAIWEIKIEDTEKFGSQKYREIIFDIPLLYKVEVEVKDEDETSTPPIPPFPTPVIDVEDIVGQITDALSLVFSEGSSTWNAWAERMAEMTSNYTIEGIGVEPLEPITVALQDLIWSPPTGQISGTSEYLFLPPSEPTQISSATELGLPKFLSSGVKFGVPVESTEDIDWVNLTIVTIIVVALIAAAVAILKRKW